MIYSTSFDEADMVSASVQTQVFKTRLYHYVDTSFITSKFCSCRYHRTIELIHSSSVCSDL